MSYIADDRVQQIYRIPESLSIFKFYQNIHVHISYYNCAKDQIKPKMLILRFIFIFYD